MDIKFLRELYPFAIPRNLKGELIENSFWTEMIPEGWMLMFLQMCEEIKNEPTPKDFYFTDVKEKWNELRCYTNDSIYSIDKIIEKYEKLSKFVCMKCGRRREPNSYLCEKCIGDKKNGF